MEAISEQLLILISTPFFLLIIGLEVLLSNYRHKQNYTLKDSSANILLMLLNGSIDLLFRGFYLIVLNYFYTHKIFDFEEVVTYWILLLLLEDFLYYWLHRFDHEIRLFWAVHVTHHSSSFLNLTVGFRSSVFQPLYRFIYFVPLAWLGFAPIDILFIYSATQIWGILVHTELVGKLGFLEYFLVTPSHHRVHHASNPKYLDKNMGMFLIIWDKFFGTFQAELPQENYAKLQYGLTSPLKKQDPVNLVFHEWKQIFKDVTQKEISLKARWMYLFGPPGWSHNGSSLTSNQMRALEAGNQLNQPLTESPLHYSGGHDKSC